MSKTITCGTSDTARGNDASDINFATCFQDGGSGRRGTDGGRVGMVENVLDEEVIDGEGAVHGADWLNDMECKEMTSSAIRVAFVETRAHK